MDASQLLCIGEFAPLSGVLIKALRLYAEPGLPEPAAVKPQRRYRLYYTVSLRPLLRVRLLDRVP